MDKTNPQKSQHEVYAEVNSYQTPSGSICWKYQLFFDGRQIERCGTWPADLAWAICKMTHNPLSNYLYEIQTSGRAFDSPKSAEKIAKRHLKKLDKLRKKYKDQIKPYANQSFKVYMDEGTS